MVKAGSEKDTIVRGRFTINIVFPVRYREALLDEELVRIIRETAAGIEER